MRWNAAYIDIPGPLEENLPSDLLHRAARPRLDRQRAARLPPGRCRSFVYFRARSLARAFSSITFHSNRSPSAIGRLFIGLRLRRGVGPLRRGSWSWEAGLNRGDHETRIGQLLNALLRNVRYLSAIGLHAGRMTVEESEEMFREKAFQDPGNARQQAARGTFDPAYLNYTLGKLMIRKLRDDWTSARGGTPGLARVSRPLSPVRRSPYSADAAGDVGRGRGADFVSAG